MQFWLDLGIDGFRVDSSAFIFEDLKLRDEPRSNVTGVTERDYKYLDHIYTMDLEETYKLFKEWQDFADSYANRNNLDQKVYEVIYCFLKYIKFIYCASSIFVQNVKYYFFDLDGSDGGVY